MDPAGNPISLGAVHYEAGQERATLWFETPDPFDSVNDAWSDLLTSYSNFVGAQETLF